MELLFFIVGIFVGVSISAFALAAIALIFQD